MRTSPIIAALVAFAFLLPFSARASEKGRANRTTWVHFHVFNYDLSEQMIDKCAALGYDKAIIRWDGDILFGGGRFTKQHVRKLVDHAAAKLDVIPAIKLLGKTKLTLGKSFVSEHPELVRHGVIDPFGKTERGGTVMQDILLPLIDEYIEIYHNPSHFLLGWDEYHTDAIKTIADRHGMTVGEVWAGTLNRVADYLLKKNITPAIFGDQLLSPLLAEEGNPLGYPADKRFLTLGGLYSKHPRTSETDLLPFVKDIKNRDKIAIAGWHYNMGSREGGYPSIDYYQWLGFKEIYGATWFGDRRIRALSKYANEKRCSGMWATLWHIPTSPRVMPLLHPVLENSIVYFKRPHVGVPPDIHPRILISSKGRPVSAVKTGETVRLRLQTRGTDLAFNLRRHVEKGRAPWVRTAFGKKETWLRPRRGGDYVEWTAGEAGFYDVLGESRDALGLTHQGYVESALLVTDTAAPRPPPSDCLLGADFTEDVRKWNGREIVVVRGEGNARYGSVEKGAKRTREGIECRDGGCIRIHKSAHDWHRLVGERTAMVEFKLLEEQAKGHNTVFSWGSYNHGLRVLVTPKRTLLGQMTYGCRPVGIVGRTALEPGRWYRVVFGADRENICLLLNEKEEGRLRVPGAWSEPHSYPVGLGAEFHFSRTDPRLHLNAVFRRFGVWDRFVRDPRL